MTKKNLTLYVEDDVQTRFKQIMLQEKSSASQKIEDYMKNYINECEGKPAVEQGTSAANYESLKQQHTKLVTDADRLYNRLEKTKQFDDLADFAKKLGLNEAYTNIIELAPTMLEKWYAKGGLKEDMHQFITFLELLRDKRQAEARLEEVRKAMAEKGRR